MVGRSRGWRLLVLGGVGVAVAVAGCTAGESEPTPTTPVETSSTSSAPQTSEPTLAAPQMPPEASEATAAGAEAWARHWVDVLNFAYATGDTSALMSLSGQDCSVCSSTADRIDSVYSDGGRIEGAQTRIDQIAAPAPDVDNLSSVSAVLTQQQGRALMPDGTERPIAGSDGNRVGFVLVYNNEKWNLGGIGSE